MNPPDTAIATTLWRARAPSRLERDDLRLALAHSRLEAAEWRVVRRGLGVMAWCLPAFLVALLGAFLFDRLSVQTKMGSGVLPLVFFFTLTLPISGAGFLVGLVLSLIPPRRARLGGWVAASVVLLVLGIALLLAAEFWREVSLSMLALSFRAGSRVLTLAGVAGLLGSHLAYCLYLAGVARRFAARRLARWCIALLVGLLLEAALLALAEASFVFQVQQVGFDWKDKLFLCSEGVFAVLGAGWAVVLWGLRQCLPREDTGDDD
jgi:hypothetical protein